MKFLTLFEQLRSAERRESGDDSIPAEERRSSVRMDVEITVDVEMKGERFPATIANITFTGLRLKLQKALKEGQELTLVRDDLGPSFKGTVLWSRETDDGYLAGVECELDEEKLINSWLLPALENAGFKPDYVIEQRRLIRVPGKIQCAVAAPDGTEYQGVTMLDLSVGGALVDCPGELTPDTVLEMKTRPPSLHCQAKVLTARETENGTWRCSLEFTDSHSNDVQAFMNAMLNSAE